MGPRPDGRDTAQVHAPRVLDGPLVARPADADDDVHAVGLLALDAAVEALNALDAGPRRNTVGGGRVTAEGVAHASPANASMPAGDARGRVDRTRRGSRDQHGLFQTRSERPPFSRDALLPAGGGGPLTGAPGRKGEEQGGLRIRQRPLQPIPPTPARSPPSGDRGASARVHTGKDDPDPPGRNEGLHPRGARPP